MVLWHFHAHISRSSRFHGHVFCVPVRSQCRGSIPINQPGFPINNHEKSKCPTPLNKILVVEARVAGRVALQLWNAQIPWKNTGFVRSMTGGWWAQVGVESIAITVQPDGGIYVQGGNHYWHPVAGDWLRKVASKRWNKVNPTIYTQILYKCNEMDDITLRKINDKERGRERFTKPKHCTL